MINISLFNDKLLEIAENYGFELTPAYLNLLSQHLAEVRISDQIIFNAFFKLIQSVKKDEWVKRFGYGGRPSVADILDILGQKKLTLEEQSIIELSEVKRIAKDYNYKTMILFQNGITNSVINDFGGIIEIKTLLSDEKKSDFFDNKFLKTWVAFAKAEKISNIATGTRVQRILVKEGFAEKMEIGYASQSGL